ncbi:MAG: hypothetical protein EOO50_14830 [Flavobacterium sp.]|uniref:Ig domain-containing protein n=1 Tax=Flavobacterium sp. TaxID=239 RepID=UPI0011F810B4|nr:Ig domain-containing protein [Flavobacterium sp.]RZJ65183.1 MAG: hypothetical protein EOO50_14830 [Flavobacterium sp.]
MEYLKRIAVCLAATVILVSCNTSRVCRGSSYDPKMEDHDFDDAMRFQNYSESVAIENIDYFTHSVAKVEGHLPDGLECNTTGNGFSITGTPIEYGTFEFRVVVEYEYDAPESEGEDDGLNDVLFPSDCSGKISHAYQIRVN